MGLDPNGSYIITISGDEENAPNNSNSRGRPNIEEVGGPGDDTGGSSIFMHTYNGTTYTMRYVTVTGAENSWLNVSSDADVLDECNASDIWDVIDGVVTIISTLGVFPEVCEFYSFCSALIPEAADIRTQSLVYIGGTSWTIKYIQIYNFQTNAWEFYASTEYVSMYYSWTHMYYDLTKKDYDSKTEDGDYGKIYSEEYNNTTYMRDQAAFAYTHHSRCLDTIDYVTYEFKGRDIITHSRWVESFEYEPA